MGCLFSLYMGLVPHLHDLKNDVSSCHTKSESGCSGRVPARDCGMSSWETRSCTHPPATGIGIFNHFFFCQEQVTLSPSWAGTKEKRLVRAGGP